MSVAGKVLRGVGFRGGSFTDVAGVTPLTGAPATELNSVHSPFVSEAFYPSRLWSVNYFGGLQGAATSTSLMLTPVQYRSDAPGSLTNIQADVLEHGVQALLQRLHDLVRDELRSSRRSPHDRPGGGDRRGQRASSSPCRSWVSLPPASRASGSRTPVPRQECGSRSTCSRTRRTPRSGPAPCRGSRPGRCEFIVQAVNGVGLVSLDDNQGAYYRPGQIPAALQTPGSLTPTTLVLSAPATGSYGSAVPLSATLTQGATPLAGQTVRFTLGGSEITAVTNASRRGQRVHADARHAADLRRHGGVRRHDLARRLICDQALHGDEAGHDALASAPRRSPRRSAETPA